jgi:hypothetical protein
MRTVIIAAAIAVVVALWLFAPHPPKNTAMATLGPAAISLGPAPISYWDAHNQAHLEGISDAAF